MDQDGNSTIEEGRTIARMLRVAAADPKYAQHVPLLQSKLGRRALQAGLIADQEPPCLQYLDAVVPRLQDSLSASVAAMEAMPPQSPPVAEVLSAAAAKVQL